MWPSIRNDESNPSATPAFEQSRGVCRHSGRVDIFTGRSHRAFDNFSFERSVRGGLFGLGLFLADAEMLWAR